MTIDEAIKALNELSDGDPETAHGRADTILCDFLKENGFEGVAAAFDRACERIGFWYA